MGLRGLFSRQKEEGEFYRDGDRIECESCGKRLRVKYFEKGGPIIVSGPEAFRGMALWCQECGFITCIECSMKQYQGKAQACPSCEALAGPTVIQDPLRRKPATA